MTPTACARLAQTFRESVVNKGTTPHTPAAKTPNKRRIIRSPERSPLLATPRKAAAATRLDTEVARADRRNAAIKARLAECERDARKAR